MQYLHIKNLEKYQPGYTDRRHIWAKLYYDTFTDEKIQALDEIDRYRFISLIVMEVWLQKPVPLTDTNLKLLGWNARKRRISLSLQMLHTLVDVRNGESKNPVPQSRVEKSRVEKSRGRFTPPTLPEVALRIKEKNYQYVDADVFLNHYKSKGWKVGGQPMKDWQAALAGWNAREKKRDTHPTPTIKRCCMCGKVATQSSDNKAYCTSQCRKDDLGW